MRALKDEVKNELTEQKTGICYHKEDPASQGLQGHVSENEEERPQPPLGCENQPLLAEEAIHQFYDMDLISCL